MQQFATTQRSFAMRFYFHLYDDRITLDEEGADLEDETAALKHGQQAALNMAAVSVQEGFLDLTHGIEVVGPGGRSLFKITFGEVVDVTNPSNFRLG